MAIFLTVMNGTQDGDFVGMGYNNIYALIIGVSLPGYWFYALGVIDSIYSPNFPAKMNSYENEAMLYVKRIC